MTPIESSGCNYLSTLPNPFPAMNRTIVSFVSDVSQFSNKVDKTLAMPVVLGCSLLLYVAKKKKTKQKKPCFIVFLAFHLIMKRYILVTRFPPVYLLHYQSEAPFHQLWNPSTSVALCFSGVSNCCICFYWVGAGAFLFSVSCLPFFVYYFFICLNRSTQKETGW